MSIYDLFGEYGQPFVLVFNDRKSEEFLLAERWRSHERVGGSRPHGRAVPNYQGLVVRGVQSVLPGRSVGAAVIELGTRGSEAGGIAIGQDHWLRLHGKDVDSETRA
ncbi:MAG: DUF2817 domain-containing protein [Terriglobia bacterium]